MPETMPQLTSDDLIDTPDTSLASEQHQVVISDEVADHIFSKMKSDDFSAEDIIQVSNWLKLKAIDGEIDAVDNGVNRLKKDPFTVSVLIDLARTTGNQHYLEKAEEMLEGVEFADSGFDSLRDSVSKMQTDLLLGNSLRDSSDYDGFPDEQTYFPEPLAEPAGYDRRSASDIRPVKKPKTEGVGVTSKEQTRSDPTKETESVPAVIMHVRKALAGGQENATRARNLASEALDDSVRAQALHEIDLALWQWAKKEAQDSSKLTLARNLVRGIKDPETKRSAIKDIGL